MHEQTIDQIQTEVETQTAAAPRANLYTMLRGFYAHLQTARRVEQQAKQLYSMSDAELSQLGITRDQIPAHLVKAYH